MFLPVLSLMALIMYFTGILNLHSYDRNYCGMTYMFEYPQYVKIPVNENDKYPGYALYAYGEGQFTERARNMRFDGVPVLFLPGNAGSHMQVRSLASIALRMGLSKETTFHFDYFTVSFNEDISGFYGGVLKKQVAFATKSIQTILELYKDKPHIQIPPNTVIIIGHSMGGVIAKRLMVEPEWVQQTSVVIALAAPLLAPVINFDRDIDNFYLETDNYWNKTIRSNEELKQKKFLLSIGGGHRDLLVTPRLTSHPDSDISVLTTAIPGVWVSTDHVGIVWCKQLTLKINRFLFNIADYKTKQLQENMTFIKQEAAKHFLTNRSMTYNLSITHANSTMIADAFWYEDNRRVYQISRPAVEKTSYLMIRLAKFPQNRFAAIEAVNLSDKDWIFGCNAKEVFREHRYCKTATSLTQMSRWTSSAFYKEKRKLATIDLHALWFKFPDWTHVIVKISPTRKPVTLNVDVNDYASRVIEMDYPSALKTGPTTIINQTEPGALYYEIKLKGLTQAKQVFFLYILPSRECQNTNHHLSVEVHMPWAKNNEYFYHLTHDLSYKMMLRVLASKLNSARSQEEDVTVTLLLDPRCTYTINFLETWQYGLCELVRHYTPALLPYMAGILLMTLRNTLINIERKGHASPILLALNDRVVQPFIAVPTTITLTWLFKMMAYLIQGPYFITSAMKNGEIFESFIDLVPMTLMYMSAIGLIYVGSVIIQCFVMFASQATHNFFFRIVWAGAKSNDETVEKGLLKVPFVVSLILMGIAGVAQGAASLIIGAAFYAFMLTKMYDEYLEDCVLKWASTIWLRMYLLLGGTNGVKKHARFLVRTTEDQSLYKEEDEKLNAFNFHLVMFLLWLMTTVMHIPALISWTKYYTFSYDPIVHINWGSLQSVCLGFCSIYLFQMKAPRKNLSHYGYMVSMLLVMSLMLLTFGPTCLYLADYLITITFICIASQQLFDILDEDDISNTYFDDGLDLAFHANMLRKSENEKKKEEMQKAEAELIETDDEAPELLLPATSASSLAEELEADSSPATSPSVDSSAGLSSSGPSTCTSTDQPAIDPAQPEHDENSVLYKIKTLQIRLRFFEQI